MSETQVHPEKTLVGPVALYGVLRAAWLAQLGTAPSRASLLVLLAQWALETGNGASCFGWNLGGIKHVPGDGHDFYVIRTTEYFDGKEKFLDQPFRSYASLEEGAADYLRLVHGRFSRAWPAVEAGDLVEFAHQLKMQGYYTAPEHSYSEGLQVRRAQLDTLIPGDPPDAPDTALADGRPAYVPPDPVQPDPPDPDESA
jgi:hypothetical protein